MDLFNTQQLNGELWNKAKLGALLCFVLAGVLLALSLLSPRSAEIVGQNGQTAGAVAPGR